MWKKAMPVVGSTPGWSTVGTHAAPGTRGAHRGPCPRPRPAPFLWAPRQSPALVRRGGLGCAGPIQCALCGQPGGRPPGCSRCCAWSHPGSSPASHRSAGQPVQLRIPLQVVPRCLRRARGIAWGTSPLRCSAPFPCGAEGLYAVCRQCARRWCTVRRGRWDHVQVGV